LGGITDSYIAAIRQRMAVLPPSPSLPQMYNLLHLFARWRSEVLAQTYIARHGRTIMAGPFAGMAYASRATEGALMPRLLGSYEAPLAPHLARIGAGGLDAVIDVGCADGYYAVGLARLWPGVSVHAYDIDPAARASCAALAEANGVADRVVVGERFAPTDFERFADRRTLAVVDIEGAEVDLLRPDLSPAMAAISFIVETHPGLKPGALDVVRERFHHTHHIERADLQLAAFDLPDWIRELSHLDQLLAVWEWRSAPTPWLIMTPKD